MNSILKEYMKMASQMLIQINNNLEITSYLTKYCKNLNKEATYLYYTSMNDDQRTTMNNAFPNILKKIIIHKKYVFFLIPYYFFFYKEIKNKIISC